VWLEPLVDDADPLGQLLRLDLAAGTATWVNLPSSSRRLLAAEGDRLVLLTTDALDVQGVVIAEAR
jgi:hypothetical protein